MTAIQLPKQEMKLTIRQLFDLAQLGDRDAFRRLLDLRAAGNEEALNAVAEINRIEAERMSAFFA